MWPAAVVSATVLTPVVVTDCFIQSAYNALAEVPIVRGMESGAANAFQIAKLNIVCAKLLLKKSLRIATRQVERRGGVGKVVQDAAGWTLDRALHPIETVGMTINGIQYGWGALQNLLNQEDDLSSNLQ
eukprot:CAMPEP_0118720884 /NCGR_PEP_ID=MMETSP0800-20121206/30376_1 /TAXON_ID=210618 ORGANISM="Striatella unipunctata, Strain CCMP2910" /NCGR_SAMPLE_ID=MMETSP0800 /ASSEMBLY_ACC=CAM_ASM_000638 /LENGTH=128 /DNA_ID=CAMNT_0006628609 /DNA_START=203 /DNA_END=589 /DNA_ORIENTATION=+